MCLRFRSDQRGAVLVLVVLLLLPMMLVMAAVVDYGRTFLVKRQLTNGVDAAALALGIQPSLSDEEARQRAEAIIKTHYSETEIGTLSNVTVVREGESIRVSASAQLDTVFLHLAGSGFEKLDIQVASEAIRKENKLEVVMVLDNTGSMGGSKLLALKSAAHTLIDILYAQDNAPELVKIGLVPFTVAVRLDNPPDEWLDKDGKSSIYSENLDLNGGLLGALSHTLLNLFDRLQTPWKGCVRARTEPYDTLDTPPSSDAPDTLWVPFFAPDEPDLGWYGNDYLHDLLILPPALIQRNIAKYLVENLDWKSRSGGKGPNRMCPGLAVQPLTNDPLTIRAAIDNMSADGFTVIPAGLAWGWRLLSPGPPFTEGAPYTDQKTIKAVILLTDGENDVGQQGNEHNKSTYSAYGYAAQPLEEGGTMGHLGPIDGSQAHATLDQKTAQLCENIKADKDGDTSDTDILLYTITFQVGSSNIKTLMTNCATDPNKYFDSSDDLTKVFEQIAVGLNQLRLAK